MKHIPDILGMMLEDAEALLKTEGLIFNIIETKPPRPPRDTYEFSGLRVIKVEENRHNSDDVENVVDESKSILVTVCRV